LFVAQIRLNERSERVLALTGDVIRFNPSNYTAWQFRRICLYELQHDLAAELDGVRKTSLPSTTTISTPPTTQVCI
jgi:hypothetical protein